MRVEEVDLPGVGRKFTIQTQSGDEIVIVVHHSGRRQMLYYEGGTGDEPVMALDLTDEEARELEAILGGVLFYPELTGAATTRVAEQAIEWVKLRQVGSSGNDSATWYCHRRHTSWRSVAAERCCPTPRQRRAWRLVIHWCWPARGRR
jgi:hypothetical protein